MEGIETNPTPSQLTPSDIAGAHPLPSSNLSPNAPVFHPGGVVQGTADQSSTGQPTRPGPNVANALNQLRQMAANHQSRISHLRAELAAPHPAATDHFVYPGVVPNFVPSVVPMQVEGAAQQPDDDEDLAQRLARLRGDVPDVAMRDAAAMRDAVPSPETLMELGRRHWLNQQNSETQTAWDALGQLTLKGLDHDKVSYFGRQFETLALQCQYMDSKGNKYPLDLGAKVRLFQDKLAAVQGSQFLMQHVMSQGPFDSLAELITVTITAARSLECKGLRPARDEPPAKKPNLGQHKPFFKGAGHSQASGSQAGPSAQAGPSNRQLGSQPHAQGAEQPVKKKNSWIVDSNVYKARKAAGQCVWCGSAAHSIENCPHEHTNAPRQKKN